MNLLVSAAIAQPFEFHANNVNAEPKVICAWDEVTVTQNSISIYARFACYDVEEGQFQLHQARLEHPLGNIQFTDGLLKSNDLLWLNEAKIQSSLNIYANELAIKNQSLQLINPTLWPCDCGKWSISAKVGALNEDWIWLSEPKLEANKWSVPIPIKKFSADGTPPRLPQLSWEEGPWVRQGFNGVDGGTGWIEYRSILGPSVQYNQPVEMTELSFTPQLHLGYHEDSQTLRGAFSMVERDNRGWLKSGVSTQLVSDNDYLSEYGTTYLARQQTFIDQRLWMSAAPFRLQVQQVSLGQEQLPPPTVLYEDSALFGPVYSYGMIGLPLGEVESPLASGRIGLGKDGRFVYGSAYLSGQYSQAVSEIEPQVRFGGFGYADIKQFRLLGRYGARMDSEGVFAEAQQDLLNGQQSIGWLRASVAIDDRTNYQVEGSAFGRLPLYLGMRPERYWLVLNHAVIQPAVYWWDGTLAIVGQSLMTLPNQKTTIRPSAVYFPQSKLWQSIGIGISQYQPKHCLEEQLSMQWFPDRKWPVVRFQLMMRY
ncbi:MAG: hypothetical protein VXZ96_03620 [Myxococcota bacterium]|nr:hypothetical protein [Myxococcota bacterium]